MWFSRQILCIVSFVSHQLILSGAESSQVVIDELDEGCSGPDCASEATQVPSLLQKAKSQISTVLPEDDDLTDEMAADLVMEELSKIGEMHGNEVKKTLAFNRQRLMLEEDEVAANRIIDEEDADAVNSDEISFPLPFPTSDYVGSFGKSSSKGKGSSAVVYYKIDDKFIYLALASNHGFVGAGLNGRNPSMRNADIIVCRDWKADGTVSVRDFHATGNKAPTEDPGQDWVVTSSGDDGGVTWCVMHRARVTCEIWEDYQAYNDDATLFGLVAWSNSNAVNDELAYHGYHQRDVMAFNFQGPDAVIKRTFPPHSQELNVVAPECTVPSQAGSYICSYHILKVDAAKEHHIIQWRAIWDKQSPAKKAKVQHHMDLNACNVDLPVGDGQLVDCTVGMASCGEVILTGVSQYSDDGDWMDDDAGIAIGGDATVKMLFSIHFYNPGNKKGVRDRGTRFLIRYTDKLRKNNFMMFIMTTSQIEIPAKTYEHMVPSYCTRECTERLQGTTEVRFIGYHMHRAGKVTGVRVVRDGHEIEPLYTVDPWDDAMSAAKIKRTLVPGDNLLGFCTYTNPDARVIPYGPELENEMCVITLSIVGPGTMKMCADLPMGQQSVPDPCKVMKNGKWTGAYRPWPVCAIGVPMTFCPDAKNKAGAKGAKPMLDTAAGHSLKFVPWGTKKRRDCVGPSPSRELVPAEAGSCSHPAKMKGGPGGGGLPKKSKGGRMDTCPEDATTHAVTEPNTIVGEIDIRGDLKVSWHTNCDKQVIDFIVEVKTGSTVGWLALGLIDGGDAGNPMGKSPNSMLGTDIVMVSPGKSDLKDAFGKGYVAPHAKTSPTATFVSAAVQCGYTYVRFQRPFSASSEGHELKPDGFIYFAAAYNLGGGGFSQKHDSAAALSLKVSLFGGRAESYRKKDNKVEPESEPEPESEAEKKANKPIATGQCPKPAKTIEQCWAWAGNAGVVFTDSKMIKKGKKFPAGCFFNPKKTTLTLNTHKKAKTPCSSKWNCVCESKHPEPEPEPESEKAWPVNAGVCAKIFTADQCLKAVEQVYGSAPPKLTKISDMSVPKGCFVVDAGGLVAYYNDATDSLAECKHAGIKACVCPVDIKAITKAPAPAPEPPSNEPKVAYKDTHAACVASNVVHVDECKEKAQEYITKHNLGFTMKKFRTFSSSKWPEGCWILQKKKKVFFNTNKASTVKCGNGGSWCMCKASFVIARKPEECTHVITTAEECEDAAISQGFNLKVTVRKYKKKFPAGCWMRKNKLYFVNGNSIAKCGAKKSACICEK